MAYEIEHKYLLKALPDYCKREGLDKRHLTQGYLPGENIHERIRKTTYPDGHTYCARDIKAGDGVTRIEISDKIDDIFFQRMWPLTEGRRVFKWRYFLKIPDTDMEWEIDTFEDRTLYLAELEIPEESFKIEIPDWLAPFIDRDVTHEPAYVNRNLAK